MGSRKNSAEQSKQFEQDARSKGQVAAQALPVAVHYHKSGMGSGFPGFCGDTLAPHLVSDFRARPRLAGKHGEWHNLRPRARCRI